MDMDADSLAALAQIFIAVAVIVGGGGGAVYVVRRKTNGQSALPGTAHDETLHELRAITKQLQKNGEANAKEHEDMLDTLAPRRVPGGGSE